jgi:hypothetical protein
VMKCDQFIEWYCPSCCISHLYCCCHIHPHP